MSVDDDLNALKSEVENTLALIDRLRARLKGIAEIIERVDQRCMAADGDVTPTKDEITAAELLEIYKLASRPTARKSLSALRAKAGA